MTEMEYRLLTALRRIRSLGEKNVPKYAQQIAREALSALSSNMNPVVEKSGTAAAETSVRAGAGFALSDMTKDRT